MRSQRPSAGSYTRWRTWYTSSTGSHRYPAHPNRLSTYPLPPEYCPCGTRLESVPELLWYWPGSYQV